MDILTVFPYKKNRFDSLLKEIESTPVVTIKEINGTFPCLYVRLKKKRGDEEVYKYLSWLSDGYRDIVVSIHGNTLVEEISNLLKRYNLTVSVAESCTGGLISHLLTQISGSSNYFFLGTVVYSNEAKVKILKVPQDVIDTYGAVHEKTAGYMSTGVRKILDTDIGLATTGIAGPTGGTAEKPVGTICVSVAFRDCSVERRYISHHGDREKNKLFFAHLALNLMRCEILNHTKGEL